MMKDLSMISARTHQVHLARVRPEAACEDGIRIAAQHKHEPRFEQIAMGRFAGEPQSGGTGVQPGPAGARQRAGLGGAAVEPDTGDGSGSDHSQGRQSAPRRSVHEWGAKPRPPPKARAKGFAPPQGARQGQFRRAVRLGGTQAAKPFARALARGAASCNAARSEPQASAGKTGRRMTGVQPGKRTVCP